MEFSFAHARVYSIACQEWMEHYHPELLEELRKTECVSLFQDAEANKQEFLHDEVYLQNRKH